MRIKRIGIKNYKVFRDVVIDRVGGMAVFVGDNGSGKSTVFDVLMFVRDCIRVGVREAVHMRGGFRSIHSMEREGDIGISLAFGDAADDDGAIVYEIAIAEREGQLTVEHERMISEGSGTILLDMRRGSGHAMAQEGQVADAIQLMEPHFLGLSTIGQLKKYEAQAQVRRAIEGFYRFDPTSPDVSSRRSTGAKAVSFPTGGTVASITQYMREHRPEAYGFLMNNLRILLPGIQGVDTVRYEDGEVQVRFQEWFQTPFGAQQMSDGVWRIYSYLLLLLDENPPSLLCIDEPENQVYPNSQRAMADFFRIYATHHQIFVATHAPTFLDAVELPEAYYIAKREGFSTVRRVQDIPRVETFYRGGDPLGALWSDGSFEEGR